MQIIGRLFGFAVYGNGYVCVSCAIFKTKNNPYIISPDGYPVSQA